MTRPTQKSLEDAIFYTLGTESDFVKITKSVEAHALTLDKLYGRNKQMLYIMSAAEQVLHDMYFEKKLYGKADSIAIGNIADFDMGVLKVMQSALDRARVQGVASSADGGWIYWGGGNKAPCDGNVQVICRDGCKLTEFSCKLRWDNCKSTSDIIAYRPTL